MQPGSSWLQTLAAEERGRFAVPVTSIYSRSDSLLVPADTAVLRGAACHELHGVGHFGLLRSRRALDATVRAMSAA
jgi:hypothetical protein